VFCIVTSRICDAIGAPTIQLLTNQPERSKVRVTQSTNPASSWQTLFYISGSQPFSRRGPLVAFS